MGIGLCISEVPRSAKRQGGDPATLAENAEPAVASVEISEVETDEPVAQTEEQTIRKAIETAKRRKGNPSKGSVIIGSIINVTTKRTRTRRPNDTDKIPRVSLKKLDGPENINSVTVKVKPFDAKDLNTFSFWDR